MDVAPAPTGKMFVEDMAEGAVSRRGAAPQASVVFTHVVRVGGWAEKECRGSAYGAETRMKEASGQDAEVLPAQISKDTHVRDAAESSEARRCHAGGMFFATSMFLKRWLARMGVRFTHVAILLMPTSRETF